MSGDLSTDLATDLAVDLATNLAGGGWLPTSLTSVSLLAWMDAASPYVALSGSDVITWTPRAGTRITAAPTQGTGSKRPAWASGGVAVSAPTVTFDGGDVLRIAHALAGDFDEAKAHQVFIVGRLLPLGGEQHIWSAGRDDAETYVGQVLSATGNLRYIRKLAGSQGIYVSGHTIPDDVDTWHYTAWAANVAKANYAGQVEGSGASAKAATGLTDWGLGGRITNSLEDRFVKAEVTHIVVTDGQPDAAEQAQLEAWADGINS